MKRIAIPAFVVVVSLLALAILAAAQSEGENLLSNGSFEILDENGSPVNWWLSVPEMQGTIDTDIKHHGQQSFKIVAKGVTKRYAGLMHEPLQLDGPATYRFSGWLKAEDLFTTDSGLHVTGALWFWVHVGKTDQKLRSFTLATPAEGTFDWTRVENEFHVPCPVHLEAGAWDAFNGTLWFDDVRIKRVGEHETTQTERGPEPEELVARFPQALRSTDGSFAVLFAPAVKKITRRVTAEDGAITAGARTHLALARNEYEAVQLVIAGLSDGNLPLAFSAAPLRRNGADEDVEGASVTVSPVARSSARRIENGRSSERASTPVGGGLRPRTIAGRGVRDDGDTDSRREESPRRSH